MARLRVLVGAILAAALVLAFAVPASAHGGGGTAKVRAFHNSPDTPAVDIYVNGAKALSDVTYGTLSGYLEVPRGTYNVQVRLAGHWYRIVRDLEFGEASGYLLLPAWSYRLRIVAAGTSTVVKDLGKVRLKGGTSSTAWAVGFLTPEDGYPGFDVFVSRDG